MRINWSRVASLLFVCAVAVIVITMVMGVGETGNQTDSQQLEVVQKAIERAAVQCYALEGAYPPNLQYLKDHYGVMVDENKFLVHYKVEGSNIRPDIQVFALYPA